MIKVVNKYKHTPTKNDVYIGRGSPLGNPFTSIKGRKTQAKYVCSSRTKSITRYEEYVKHQIEIKNRLICDELNKIYLLAKKGDVHLVCFCAPKACHGDIIKKIIESKL